MESRRLRTFHFAELCFFGNWKQSSHIIHTLEGMTAIATFATKVNRFLSMNDRREISRKKKK